jgi:uncharacterized protein (DUF305 family)
LEVELVLFSRAFIRKRMISLATTASVAAISFVSAQDPAKTHQIHRAIQYVADRQAEQTLVSERAGAMHGMMADMTIKPIRTIDRDFVEMLVPRHQGAVEMARVSSNEFKYGGDERLRRQPSEQRRAVLPQLGPIDGSAAHGGMKLSLMAAWRG